MDIEGSIRVMPEALSNKIAAGEVVQRPASAVKELLENAVDAGAGSITLILKRAGSELIQIVDDGCGMSRHDAAACFQRHATSKVFAAEDLDCIRTLGFRGKLLRRSQRWRRSSYARNGPLTRPDSASETREDVSFLRSRAL